MRKQAKVWLKRSTDDVCKMKYGCKCYKNMYIGVKNLSLAWKLITSCDNSSLRSLTLHELAVVDTALLHQLCVRSLLDQPTLRNDQDYIRVNNRA